MKKKCVAGKVKAFPQALAESLVCNHFFQKAYRVEFLPTPEGTESTRGRNWFTLVDQDETGVVSDAYYFN